LGKDRAGGVGGALHQKGAHLGIRDHLGGGVICHPSRTHQHQRPHQIGADHRQTAGNRRPHRDAAQHHRRGLGFNQRRHIRGKTRDRGRAHLRGPVARTFQPMPALAAKPLHRLGNLARIAA
jgi:hypothetical protein